eukprot:TRINITY_DN7385_c0_g2_i1.p1 TRINITY_DN7385_c0_g2~~TRINITY_DN7385_c0_g2_i1.p1  ORF type:complete len:489 (-),score=82.88 TRINITY_DN7385_c0_g2_i1:95-1561(-)
MCIRDRYQRRVHGEGEREPEPVNKRITRSSLRRQLSSPSNTIKKEATNEEEENSTTKPKSTKKNFAVRSKRSKKPEPDLSSIEESSLKRSLKVEAEEETNETPKSKSKGLSEQKGKSSHSAKKSSKKVIRTDTKPKKSQEPVEKNEEASPDANSKSKSTTKATPRKDKESPPRAKRTSARIEMSDIKIERSRSRSAEKRRLNSSNKKSSEKKKKNPSTDKKQITKELSFEEDSAEHPEEEEVSQRHIEKGKVKVEAMDIEPPLQETSLEKSLEERPEEKPEKHADIVFCIDASGSMHPFLNLVKKSMLVALNELEHPAVNIRFGIVAYRDHTEDADQSFVTRVLDLTTDHEAVRGFLSDLDARGGGDLQEAVLDGLKSCATDIKWHQLSGWTRRLVVHLADSPPHGKEFGIIGSHPAGCPCGVTLSEISKHFNELQISYQLVRCHSITDRMSEVFVKQFPKCESRYLPDFKNITSAISEFINRELLNN